MSLCVQELLKNYDDKARQIVLKVDQDFNRYREDFNTYPHIEDERKLFLQQQQENSNSYKEQTTSSQQLNEKFNRYWMNRIQVLRNMEIEIKIEKIRKSWREIVGDAKPIADAAENILKQKEEVEYQNPDKRQKLESPKANQIDTNL